MDRLDFDRTIEMLQNGTDALFKIYNWYPEGKKVIHFSLVVACLLKGEYFRESDFDQARKRTEKFPLLLCVAAESEVLLLEEKLQKIGAAYKKEKISDSVYMEL